MTIAEKYAAQWLPNGEVSLADLIQAAVDEATDKLRLIAVNREVVELQERIHQLEAQSVAVDEAQSVPVVGGLFDLEKLESLGWQIAVCQMCGTHASAIKPVQSVPVVGEPWRYVVNKSDGTPLLSVCSKEEADKYRAREGLVVFPVFREPNGAITAAELATLREKAARLEHELETERMRLTACGVIAMANTVDSAAKARDMLPEYWSASARNCAFAVDREMDYRSRLAVAEQERDELRKRSERMQKALSDIAEWTDRYPPHRRGRNE